MGRVRVEVGLYTILLLPILYGVWHMKEGRGEGIYCANVAQCYCSTVGNAKWAGVIKG